VIPGIDNSLGFGKTPEKFQIGVRVSLSLHRFFLIWETTSQHSVFQAIIKICKKGLSASLEQTIGNVNSEPFTIMIEEGGQCTISRFENHTKLKLKELKGSGFKASDRKSVIFY